MLNYIKYLRLEMLSKFLHMLATHIKSSTPKKLLKIT